MQTRVFRGGSVGFDQALSGARMHGEQHLGIAANCAQGCQHVAEPREIVNIPGPMERHKREWNGTLAIGEGQRIEQPVRICARQEPDQRVDHHISDAMNPRRGDTFAQQEDEIRIFGAPVSLFLPKNRSMQGYELELNPTLDSFVQDHAKCFIDWSPKRSVFYRFNWFPDGQDSLVAVTFSPQTTMVADALIRTVDQLGNEGPYGDVLLKVVKLFDVGKYQVLSRVCFAKVLNDEQLWKVIAPRAARS